MAGADAGIEMATEDDWCRRPLTLAWALRWLGMVLALRWQTLRDHGHGEATLALRAGDCLGMVKALRRLGTAVDVETDATGIDVGMIGAGGCHPC